MVGNLTVGGAGKTPLVLWLAQFLQTKGWRPGIVSRGYGGQIGKTPHSVRLDDDPRWVGDEPLLLARRAGVPVVVGKNRVAAGRHLIEQNDCTIVIADDGLQHYALARDVEILVIDRARGFGNGYCLPAGPLREPMERLAEAHLLVSHGQSATHEPLRANEYTMTLAPRAAVALASSEMTRPLAHFQSTPVHAVAGIGHPSRFFSTLRAAGLTVIEHPFPDHHRFIPADLDFGDALPILMTEKDAVKCEQFAGVGCWHVPVTATLSPDFGKQLLERL